MTSKLNVAGAWLRGAFADQTFGRAILQIMSGNAISQVIMLLGLPVITRLYDPEDISLLAVYVAILTIIAVAVCLRLEIAIPIPESDETAANLAVLALLSSVAVTVLVALGVVGVWIADIRYLTGQPLWEYAWLFPFGTLAAGLFTASSYWSARKRRFSLIGRTRAYQGIVGVATQIGAGMLQIIPLGLLLGHLMMTSAGFLNMIRVAEKKDRHLFREVSFKKMRQALVSNIDFPKFSIIEGLATTGAQQITIVLIAMLSVGAEAGFFFLAARVLTAPTSLVTNAVSQVYLQRAPDHLRNGTLRQFTRKVLISIAIIFLPPFAILGFFAVPAFEMVFGSEWTRAGEMAVLLLPMSLFSLFSASIGMVMNVTRRQRQMMRLKIMGFTLRVGSVMVTALFAPELLIEAYAAASFVVFIVYFWIFYAASGSIERA